MPNKFQRCALYLQRARTGALLTSLSVFALFALLTHAPRTGGGGLGETLIPLIATAWILSLTAMSEAVARQPRLWHLFGLQLLAVVLGVRASVHTQEQGLGRYWRASLGETYAAVDLSLGSGAYADLGVLTGFAAPPVAGGEAIVDTSRVQMFLDAAHGAGAASRSAPAAEMSFFDDTAANVPVSSAVAELSTFCVAPIVVPEMAHVWLWAGGLDCCAGGVWRCGSGRQGLRLDRGEGGWGRAVAAARARLGMVPKQVAPASGEGGANMLAAQDDVFVELSDDAEAALASLLTNSRSQQAMQLGAYLIGMILVGMLSILFSPRKQH